MPLTPNDNRQYWLGYEQKNLDNLNDATINVDGFADEAIRTRRHRASTTHDPHASVIAIFDHHVRHLCETIEQYPVVVGCVAWLTNEDILLALRGRTVNIIVQKEDWLRPDRPSGVMKPQTRAHLYSLYGALTGIGHDTPTTPPYDPQTGLIDKYCFGLGYNQCGDPCYDPVLCAGMIGERAGAPPRMHHKFLVFGNMKVMGGVPFGHPEYARFVPEAVWTGSFNFTWNATRSLENAVFIGSSTVAEAYCDEWATVLGFAEPLDWNAEWIASHHRIGT